MNVHDCGINALDEGLLTPKLPLYKVARTR